MLLYRSTLTLGGTAAKAISLFIIFAVFVVWPTATVGTESRRVHHSRYGLIYYVSLSLSLSLSFNGHFPGEPGLAGVYIEAKDYGGGGDNWTTGAISRAKLQSSHHHQQTNIQFFLQAGCPSCRPSNSVKALKGMILLLLLLLF